MKEEAETYRLKLLEILKINPKDIKSLIHLGVLEFEYFHNHDLAISTLHKAIALDITNILPKFWIAMCFYYDFCEYEKAEKFLKEALQYDPNSPECLSLMGWIIQDTNRSIDLAIEYVTKAIQHAPSWPMLRCQLATFYITQGDLIAAEKEINRMFQISPMDQGKIANEVERYYEWVITGRSWDDEAKKNLQIVKKLEKYKLDKKNK